MHMLESQIRVNKLDPATTIVAVEPREGETFLRTDDVIAAIENEPEVGLGGGGGEEEKPSGPTRMLVESLPMCGVCALPGAFITLATLPRFSD